MGLLSLHRYNLVIIGIPIINLVIVSLYKEYLCRPNPSSKTRVELAVALVHT